MIKSKDTIILFKKELIREKRNENINKINCYCFSSILSYEDICKASLILFKDGSQIKILKSRYF